MATALTTVAATAPDSGPGAVPDAPDPQLRQRDYLLRVARALSADLDLQSVLARVIRAGVAMTGGQAGAIALRQPDGEMRVVASFQLEERFEHFLDPFLHASAEDVDSPIPADDAGEASPPKVAFPAPRYDLLALPLPASGGGMEPSLARLTSATGGVAVYDVAAGAEAARQVLALPLEIGPSIIGRIFVFRSDGAAAFTPLDTQLLQTFADQAAVAIQNADAHARLQARERRLSALVEHSPAGSLLVGPDRRIVAHNPTAATLLGATGGDLVGRDLRAAVRLADAQGQAMAVGLPDGPGATTTLQGHVRREDGRTGAWVQATFTALPSPRGGQDGFVVDVVDLTGYKEAEDAKRAFLAGLSHALKTPLALIRGFAETLRYPHVRSDDALADEALDVILDETGHLTRMVDQLLEAARLEAGALKLERHTVDLATELRRVVETFRGAHPDRQWRVAIAGELPPIWADPLRLREVLQNLLSNAVKYSGPDSPIDVRAGAAGDGRFVELAVADRGVGIAPQDQSRVFERFERAGADGEGAGLGLYMTRAIVQAHGGRVELASEAGAGSTFTVTLPIAGEAAEAVATEAFAPRTAARPSAAGLASARSPAGNREAS